MKIVLMVVGRSRNVELASLTEEYLSRAVRYMPVEMQVIPDVKASKGISETEQKLREGRAILEGVTSSDYLWLLDERGKMLTSREFATAIEKHALSGVKRLVLVVGGPYGFSKDVYARADGMLSLSKMTFTHEMVRLFIAEQVYRAMTILRGEQYHHD